MNWCKERFFVRVLCGFVALYACGGGGGNSAGPDDEVERGIPPEAVAVTNVLVQSFQSAFFASLAADTTAVVGFNGGGLVQIEGKKWTMIEYSPDGVLFLDGTLNVDKGLYPNIPVKGTINMSGAQEGVLVLDMTVIVQENILSATGTVQLDGVVYDMADLIAAQ